MMLLGLVLHTSLTYNVTPHGEDWPLKDPMTTHIFSDFIVLIIHSFRMPIFFIVAGFFGAMLFYQRGEVSMMKNRISRVVLPFLVFLVLLWPFIVFLYGYTQSVFSGEKDAFLIALQPLISLEAFIPQSTFHLWFLYYLILITSVTLLVVLLSSRVQLGSNVIVDMFDKMIQRPLIRVLVVACIVFFTLSTLGTSMVMVSVSLIPDLNTFVYFIVFYWLGWLIYLTRKHMYSFTKYNWFTTLVALVLLIGQGILIRDDIELPGSSSTVMILLTSLTVSLFSFGIMGLFIKYTSRYSSMMKYLSDASYWVYLIHLPIVILLPSLVMDLQVPAFIKFLLVLSGATFFSFVTYHYLVRSTFIGQFLNGRKYPIN